MNIHVCNAFFEWELSRQAGPSLEQALSQHPAFTMLQFLPLLYAAPDEGVVVTSKPDLSFFQSLTLQMPKALYFPDESLPAASSIIDWGASLLIKEWADARQATYALPNWDLVQTLSSKLFSFARSPLPGARQVFGAEEIEELARQIDQPFVVKDCLENAGRGHFFLLPGRPVDQKSLRAFTSRNHPLIAEPWVHRLIDFSTQWEITPSKGIRYIGLTICHNDAFGKYRASEVGNPSFTFDPKIYDPLLHDIAALGFFGHLGIDAMIYRAAQGPTLQPIVEINPRKTMGYVALAFQQRHFPGVHLTLSLSDLKESGLLPKSAVTREGRRVKFRKTVSWKEEGILLSKDSSWTMKN
jgi:hypothetical protein